MPVPPRAHRDAATVPLNDPELSPLLIAIGVRDKPTITRWKTHVAESPLFYIVQIRNVKISGASYAGVIRASVDLLRAVQA